MQETNKDLSSLKWSVRQRLEFLEKRVYWQGRLNRRDIMNAFDVSNLQATRDIGLYQEIAPENLVYDKSVRAYFPSENFHAIVSEISSDEMLAELTSGGNDDVSTLVTNPNVNLVPIPKREVPTASLRATLEAITCNMQINVYYQSMSSPEPSWRWIEPHSLVNDGLRWQVRAFCCTTDMFKDFLLSRILKVDGNRPGQALSSNDVEWNSMCDVVLVPHKNLSSTQKKTIEMDYKMRGGELVLEVRRALVPYLLQRLNLTMVGSLPSTQQIEIQNLDELGSVATFNG